MMLDEKDDESDSRENRCKSKTFGLQKTDVNAVKVADSF